ncbi:hypothetical protein Bca4012_083639 [Brassica carinata]|uniref:DUF4283 domain-containing protein n=1 Tax=Brassica carinata TaxID=52824 RepID=A0A8X7SHV4_BRACI|nr:hypothetical protein Bca52824_027087 [Brassica carinata]
MVSMDPFPPDVESPHSGGTPLEKQSSSWHKEHTSDASSTDCETIKIINGEASIQIPSAILADPNLLWKSFYWHVSDVLLVVNEWSLATASADPDLTGMPMLVDLKGVPSHLFSRKGIKCLAGATVCFVKLHPTTKKCVRFDVVRVLVEVNLQKPLVERISSLEVDGSKVTVEVSYLWLPQRCATCKKWGHKGGDSDQDTETMANKRLPLGLLKNSTEVRWMESIRRRRKFQFLIGILEMQRRNGEMLGILCKRLNVHPSQGTTGSLLLWSLLLVSNLWQT